MENGFGKKYRRQHTPAETILTFESLKVRISGRG
jgi:hypothetical protein